MARLLERFLSRYVSDWPGADRSRTLDGTLVYVDISGFTALAEKLAQRGRIGAEELTDVLNAVFGDMLDRANARGASLLKFGGDALLLLFAGEGHAVEACGAVVEMKASLRAASGRTTSAGKVRLRASIGVHSGEVLLFAVGDSHRELIITGPAASETTRMEEAATAGQVLISDSTKALLPEGSAPKRCGPGWLLGWRQARTEPGGIVVRPDDGVDPRDFLPIALREHLVAGHTEPSHTIASIGFIKFTGLDRIVADEGVDAAGVALEQLVGAVQNAVDAEGVTFLASDIDEDGGKIILAAGVPLSQEDDEGRILRACQALLTADHGPLDIRIGANQGHVFVGDIGTEQRATFTVMGDTVNLAARMMAAAPVGQLYATPSVLNGSSTLFQVTPLEPMVVKGKERPVTASSVGRPSGRRRASTEDGLPFVGRTEEFNRLLTLVDQLAVGRGGVISLLGERGVGKSRLVDEVLEARDQVLKIEFRAEPYGTSTPYRPLRGPVRELLGIRRAEPARMATQLRRRIRRFAPDLMPFLPLVGDVTQIPTETTPEVEALDQQFRHAKTADVLTDLLSRRFDGPVIFHIEDAHYLDQASTESLERLATATGEHPWLMIVTRRDGTEGFYPPGEGLRLAPLTEEFCRSAIETATEARPLRPHEVSAIVQRSGGLPLFVDEIVRAVRTSGSVDSLPDSIEALVSAQIDALPPLARRVLRYASVLGLSFRAEAFDDLTADEPMALDDATRKTLGEFVERDGPDRLMFRHAVIRDVAYQGLSFRRRRELHRLAGEAAERKTGDAAALAADMLSLHFALANEHQRAWKYARIAGDQAVEAYANVDATSHYRRALESASRLRGIDAASRAEVWRRLGDAYDLAGQYGEAFDAFRRAGQLLSDNVVAKAELRLRRAVSRRQSGAYRAALRELSAGQRMIADLGSVDAVRAQGRLVVERGSIRRWQQRPRDVLPLGEQAEDHARRCGDLATLGQALDLIHWSHRMMGNSEHEAPYAETLAIYEELGDLPAVARVWNNKGADAFYAGHWDDAVKAYVESSDAARRAGDDIGAAISDANTAEILVNQGRHEEADPILRNALRVLQASDHAPAAAFVESEIARLMIRRGDHASAAPRLIDIRDRSVQAGEALTALNARLMLAEVELIAGSPNEALDLVGEAQSAAGDLAQMFGPNIARLRALALSRSGRVDDAIQETVEAVAEARRQGLTHDLVQLLFARAEIAAHAGRTSDPDELAEAERLCQELGIRPGAAAATTASS